MREVAVTAVTTLAERCPHLQIAGPWKRFVGIDDGYLAAPAESGINPPIGLPGRR